MQTAETLTLLAKEAAASYLERGVPLNDAILAIKEAHNLSEDETRRVIERANTAVALHKFHTSPEDDRYITFDVADPYKILGKPEVKKASFRRPREGNFQLQKFASFNKSLSELLQDAHKDVQIYPTIDTPEHPWYEEECTKEASLDSSSYLIVKEAAEIIYQRRDVAKYNLEKTREEFRKCAAAVLREVPLSEVIESLIPFTKSASHLQELKPVVDYLAKRGKVKVGSLREEPPEPNPEHPMIKAFVKLGESLEEVQEREKEAQYAASVVNARRGKLINDYKRSKTGL